MIDIDVIIHVEEGYKKAKDLITSIYKEQKVVVKKIVVALTSKNNDEENRFKDFCKEKDVFLFEIESWYFSSSLTIQRAIRHYCNSDIVVVLNQNIKLIRTDSLYNLVKDIASKKCAYTFGRQIVKKNGLEKLLFNELFRASPLVINSDNYDELKKETYSALIAYFALDRNLFLKLNGYQDYEHLLEANAYYMRKLIDDGYALRYSSESLVENPYRLTKTHVHDCYFYLAKFMAKNESMASYKDNNNPRLRGILAKKLLKHGNFIGLIRMGYYKIVKKRAEIKVRKINL